MFANTLDAYLLIKDGIIIHCNSAAELFFRVNKNLLLGNTPVVISPEKQPDGNFSEYLVKQKLEEAFIKGSVKFEWLHKRFDETQFYTEIVLTHIKISDNDYIIAACRDITVNKSIMSELNSQNSFMNLLLDNIVAGVIIVDPVTHTIENINHAALNMLGSTREEVMGKRCHKFICPAEEGNCPITDLDQKLDNSERILLSNSGDVIPILKSIKKININGKVKLLETFFDISSHKITQNQLEEKEANIEFIVTHIQDVVYSVDTKTQEFSFLSPVFEKITGYNINDINGAGGRVSFLKSVLYENHLELWEEFLDNVRREQKKSDFVYESWWICKDGTLKCLQDHWMPVYKNNELISTVGVLQDITERKKQEDELISLNQELTKLNEDLDISRTWVEDNLFEQNLLVEELEQTKEKLEKLNNEKNKFFSIIAHDLKSPFQGFVGLTELMANEVTNFTIAELSLYTKEMHKTASNLFILLQNLLEWAQMQKDTVDFKPAIIDLVHLFENNIDLLEQNLIKKNIMLEKFYPAKLSVYADEKMINSVLRNLLSNAVKFTPKNGKIAITTRLSGNSFVEIKISDNGIGMSEQLTGKLFKIEEKVGRKGTEGEESTGLGLLLCKEFVNKNDGDIWVESFEGVGTTFTFTVPLAENEPTGIKKQTEIV